MILERKRAEEIYNDIRTQALDPGLLQMGERDADEARRTSIFSARVVPIPAYGTKRIEIEYQERLAVERGGIVIRDSSAARRVSRADGGSSVDHSGREELRTRCADFQFVSKAFPMQMAQQSARR